MFVLGGLHETRDCLADLMKSGLFVGMLGGIPNFARYFVGFQRDPKLNSTELFYLDPHVVISNKQMRPEDYHCKEYRSVPLKDIEKAVGICFYLRNPDDIVKLKDLLTEVKERFHDSLPFGAELRREEAKMQELKDAGIRLINDVPQVLPGRKMAFIHPKSASGVLVALYEITAEE